MQQADPLVGRKLASRQTVSQRTMDLPVSEGEETQEDLASSFRSRPSMVSMCATPQLQDQLDNLDMGRHATCAAEGRSNVNRN